MNPGSPLSERVQRAFEPTGSGVVGLVDALLDACPEQGLQLHWHAGRCCVRPLGAPTQGSTEMPLPKSVFRAVLARMAALCNERIPDSVSPYGGEGDVSIDTQPPKVFHVAFTNTPGEQRLEVRRLGDQRDRASADLALEPRRSRIRSRKSGGRTGSDAPS